MGREFREICEAAGLVVRRPGEGRRKTAVRAVTFHSLRHACVTAAAAAGVDMTDIQRLVGHSSVGMTERYDHSEGEAAALRVARAMPVIG
jgi:integrase